MFFCATVIKSLKEAVAEPMGKACIVKPFTLQRTSEGSGELTLEDLFSTALQNRVYFKCVKP